MYLAVGSADTTPSQVATSPQQHQQALTVADEIRAASGTAQECNYAPPEENGGYSCMQE